MALGLKPIAGTQFNFSCFGVIFFPLPLNSGLTPLIIATHGDFLSVRKGDPHHITVTSFCKTASRFCGVLWPSVGGTTTMASQSSPLDDPATFRSLMIECHLPSIQIEHIVTSGYTTIALLAHGVHDESTMEEFVDYLSLIPAGERSETFSPQSASIRRVLKECISRCVQSGRESSTESSITPLVKSKLSMVDVKALRADFCQNYPGELLTSQSMPSLSFLSILKEAIDGNCLAWVPWKSRTSEADEQAFLEHRRPRNERQLLRSLLSEGKSALHDQPEAVINHQLSPEVVVTRFQGLLSTALAMLGQAHLLVLKRFHAKFLEIALLKPRDQHLRSPSLTEILDADRVAWTSVVELLADSKWSLNDVLNEVAFCRQVFHTSLAPRPEPLQSPRTDRCGQAGDSGWEESKVEWRLVEETQRRQGHMHAISPR